MVQFSQRKSMRGRKRKFKKRLQKHRGRFRGNSVVQKQLVIADRTFAKLKYIDVDTPFLGVTGSPSSVYYQSYNANSAWDVNVALASAIMPGMAEYAGFYARYRVRACKIECELANMNTMPCMLMVHLQDDAAPTTFNTWAAFRKFEGNRYTKVRLVGGPDGQNRTRISMYVDLARYNGDVAAYEADIDYTGSTGNITVSFPGASPVHLFKIYVALLSGDGTTGIDQKSPLKTTITQYIEFFDRVDLVT